MTSRSLIVYLGAGLGVFVIIAAVGLLLATAFGIQAGTDRTVHFTVLMCAIAAGLTVAVALSLVAYEVQGLSKKLRRRKRRPDSRSVREGETLGLKLTRQQREEPRKQDPKQRVEQSILHHCRGAPCGCPAPVSRPMRRRSKP